MPTLPAAWLPLIAAFAPLFSKRVWAHAQSLLIGAILAPGKRTVTACLRIVGKHEEAHFQSYHRVLNRARWSALGASRVLLRFVIQTFSPKGEVVVGIDDTIERRRGDRIKAKGIYRDPVRSSHSHFVKASGLRWWCGMVLVDVRWAGGVWALPFLTLLCPSQRYYSERQRQHQRLTDRAWQMIRQLARWLPNRTVVLVADSSFAVLDLLNRVSGLPGFSLITRLRVDAELWAPPPQRRPGQTGRPRIKGARRPSPQQRLASATTPWRRIEVDGWYGGGVRTVEVYSETALWYKSGHVPVPIRWVLVRDPQGEFDPHALLSTNPLHTSQHMLSWFVRRWRREVTFAEARAHLGMETQRQWRDRAIARSTPILLGLFSLVTLLADSLMAGRGCPVRTAAWYAKPRLTFVDAIALVRRHWWGSGHFSTSGRNVEALSRALCSSA